MARADKHVTSARNYSLGLLMLSVVLVVVVGREGGRWTTLAKARELMARWLVHDIVAEDFEEWWLQQQVDHRPLTATYSVSAELNAGKERYYTEFGAALVERNGSKYTVSVRQPSAAPPLPPGVPDLPDLRAPIPDLRPWSRVLPPTASLKRALSPLTQSEAAALTAQIGLNSQFRNDDPRGRLLPQRLQERWVADGRWLSLGAEREAATVRLRALLSSQGVKAEEGDTTPTFYRRLERSLTASEMRVPILDIQLPILLAVWVISLLVALNFWLLAGALRGLLKENQAPQDDQWLVLDSPRDFVARSWLALIAVCPVAVPVMAIAYCYFRFAAGDGTGLGFLVVALLLSILACLGTVNSRKTLGYVREASRLAATPNGQESPTEPAYETPIEFLVVATVANEKHASESFKVRVMVPLTGGVAQLVEQIKFQRVISRSTSRGESPPATFSLEAETTPDLFDWGLAPVPLTCVHRRSSTVALLSLSLTRRYRPRKPRS